MKNKSIRFIVIVLLAWFFAKDNKAPTPLQLNLHKNQACLNKRRLAMLMLML